MHDQSHLLFLRLEDQIADVAVQLPHRPEMIVVSGPDPPRGVDLMPVHHGLVIHPKPELVRRLSLEGPREPRDLSRFEIADITRIVPADRLAAFHEKAVWLVLVPRDSGEEVGHRV